MKKLYSLILLVFLFASTVALGQSPASPEWNSQPQLPKLKKENAFPMLGFSVSIPLFRRYTQSRQLKKLQKLPPKQPPLNYLQEGDEEGPIAWEMTAGGEVIVRGKRDNGPDPAENSFDTDPFFFPLGPGGGGGSSGSGGRGGSSLTDSPASDNEKNTQTVEGICTGLMTMLALQKQAGKEAAAFVTTDGKVIILPMSENTEIESQTHSQYKDSEGRILVNVYQEDGKWMVQLSDFSTGTATFHQLSYHVHTHPQNGNQNIPSDTDKAFANGGAYLGLSTYIVNNKNLIRYDGNGTNTSAKLKEICSSN